MIVIATVKAIVLVKNPPALPHQGGGINKDGRPLLGVRTVRMSRMSTYRP